MGFLSGIVGGLLGGGQKTSVSNKNETTVKNDIAVNIDLSGIQSAIESIGQMFGATQETQTDLSRQQLTLALLQAAQQGKTNDELGRANKTFRQLVYGALGIGFFWFLAR